MSRLPANVHRSISRHLNDWDQGSYNVLVQYAEHTPPSSNSSPSRRVSEEQMAVTYSHLVLGRKLQWAYRYLNRQDQGTVIKPEDEGENTGGTVSSVHHGIHSAEHIPDTQGLEGYGYHIPITGYMLQVNTSERGEIK